MVGVAPVPGAKTAEIEAGESGSWLPGSAWLATSPDVVPGLPARDAPEAAAAVDSAGMVAATAVALVADMSGVLAGMPGSSELGRGGRCIVGGLAVRQAAGGARRDGRQG